MGCRYSLSWESPNTSGGHYSLTVTVNDGVVSYVDYSRNTNAFSPNSLGAINGLNYEEIRLGEDTPLSEVAALFAAIDD